MLKELLAKAIETIKSLQEENQALKKQVEELKADNKEIAENVNDWQNTYWTYDSNVNANMDVIMGWLSHMRKSREEMKMAKEADEETRNKVYELTKDSFDYDWTLASIYKHGLKVGYDQAIADAQLIIDGTDWTKDITENFSEEFIKKNASVNE